MLTHTLTREMETGPDICDITGDLQVLVDKSGIITGIVQIFIPGATGSVTALEYEPGVVEDLKRAINELAPPDRLYDHELAWHDGNGHSHVQAALLGPSISVPVRKSELALGTWQQIVVINHDNGPRSRKIEITIIGN
ncbi:MAG: secondary thiamine-phosphate synthase enzyme YjbQ [Desulfobacterales bacterium]|nr:secondary thiamine-phosphate synthase enzyme YjbQ [Desulfobacterales bacterium]